MHTMHMSLLGEEYCSGSLIEEDGFTGRIRIAAGVFLIMNNKSTEGLTSMLGPLLGIVGIFIYAKNKQKKELEEKDRAIKRN